jgi:hypothetical protein
MLYAIFWLSSIFVPYVYLMTGTIQGFAPGGIAWQEAGVKIFE